MDKAPDQWQYLFSNWHYLSFAKGQPDSNRNHHMAEWNLPNAYDNAKEYIDQLCEPKPTVEGKPVDINGSNKIVDKGTNGSKGVVSSTDNKLNTNQKIKTWANY